MKSQYRVVFGVTACSTAELFLDGLLGNLSRNGLEVHLIVGDRLPSDSFLERNSTKAHLVRMRRDPSATDPKSLWHLFTVLRELAPDAVVVGTPKMGVLGSLASWFLRIPRRVLVIHGIRWEGAPGVLSRVLWGLDRLACRLATDVVAVSASLAGVLSQTRVCGIGRAVVLGHGSSNGVDIDRFVPRDSAVARRHLRVAGDGPVLCFVGRLVPDKGIDVLPAIWDRIRERFPTAKLLIAGSLERQFGTADHSADQFRSLPGSMMLGEVRAIETVFNAADLHISLSRREGLGMVALEAAASGIPTVAMRATGLEDAVSHNRTGLLIDNYDIERFVNAVCGLLSDPERMSRMGVEGRQVVVERFEQHKVWDQWVRFLGAESLRNAT